MKKYYKQYSKILFFTFLFLAPKLLKAEIVERVVAVVNDEVITLHDLDSAMAPLKSQKKDPELPHKVLEDLIDQKLLERQIKKSKIEVGDDDLRHAVATVLQRNQITIDALKEELSSKGISFEAYKEQLKKQIRQNKFIQQNMGSKVQVSEQEMQNYRKKHQGLGNESTSVRLVSVFLPFEEGDNAKDRRKLVREGEAIVDRARRGEDLAVLDKSAKEQNGRLGDLPKDLASVVSRMEPGAISDPVQTPEGVYVVKLLERSAVAAVAEANKNEDEIWQQIFNEKMNDEIHNYLLRLRKKAYVEVYE